MIWAVLENTPACLACALFAALAISACSGDSEEPPPEETGPELQILDMRAPSPVVEGTVLRLEMRGLRAAAGGRFLQVLEPEDQSPLVVLDELSRSPEDAASELSFALSRNAVDRLGEGERAVMLTVNEADRKSLPYQTRLAVAPRLAVKLVDAPGGSFHRNDLLVLRGEGLLAEGEGRVEAELRGRFVPDRSDGSPSDVSVRLPVELAEELSRERGVARLTTAVGGIEPGTFDGTILLHSVQRSGHGSESEPLPISLAFLPPALFSFEPASPVLGQVLSFFGGGFVGTPQEPDEVTLLRFEGAVTSNTGASLPLSAAEVVAELVSGQELRMGIEVKTHKGRLVSDFFSVSRGVFSGTVTPLVIKGKTEVEGNPTETQIRIAGMRQVVVIRLLPSYYDSLRRFGLSSAAGAVADAIVEHVRSLYAGYAVEIRTEPPTDFLPAAYSTVEIGGPDPNGMGLFGYDNTPGKDTNNLRLFDSIGGTNARTQADGYPGYGGVFIESYLWWSAEPGLSGPRPQSSPEPDPLFDEIFDPVRANPATLDDLQGKSDSARSAAVQHAALTLGRVIGETVAHELGHSLGLAQPYGPAGAFHSAVPGKGCLMDAGSDRPFGERAGLPGFTKTHFCADEPKYLSEVLGE